MAIATAILGASGYSGQETLDPPAGAIVVDLSGAHRLDDPSLYPAWYGFEHPAAGSLGAWSYAIPELFPPEGPLIANPGCYATAVLLALAPLVDSIEPTGIVVDAKSGVSGAGRTLKASSHATAVLENVSPYKVGSHQHAPEIEQALGFPVCFVPHLLPVKRGLLATCYVTAKADLRAALEAAYATAPAGTPPPGGDAAGPSRGPGTDAPEIGAFTDRATGTGIVVCAIDNLGKGAAGQAVQNANVALGKPETAGLRLAGGLG